MQSSHEKLRAAATPAERPSQMEEQRQATHEGSAMMNEMMEGGAFY